MSLRWQIMGSTVLVIVLTVLASAGVGYYATQSRLGDFVDRIGDDESKQLARSLSREYTAAGSWETADDALSQAGYLQFGDMPTTRPEEREGEHSESSHQDRVRVVIAGVDGRVVRDNLSELPPGSPATGLAGRRETVFDLTASEQVGNVYVDVHHKFLSSESQGFLSTLLYITVIAGILTAGVAVLLAAWLSKRITAPVAALTEATQAIAQGDTARLPVTSEDELGQMSQAFNRMTSALENQRELRGRLINDLSHELNTPLSVIQLEATALRDGLQTPKEASGHIIQEVDRLRGLVTDLNWLAETDHGDFRLTLEAGSIDELLTAEIERWQPQSQARQVELSLEISDGLGLPEVELDRARISQALGNVLNNAISCTEAGGHVQVNAELESDGTLAIRIVDDGIGMDAEDVPRLFDRFFRTNRSQSRGIGGTGLGLAITKAIVEAHGGKVTIASLGPGHGATVTVHFPLTGQELT